MDENLPQRLRDGWEPGGDIYAAADELDQLRAGMKAIIGIDTEVQEGGAGMPVTWTGQCAAVAIKALGGIDREQHLALGRGVPARGDSARPSNGD